MHKYTSIHFGNNYLGPILILFKIRRLHYHETIKNTLLRFDPIAINYRPTQPNTGAVKYA